LESGKSGQQAAGGSASGGVFSGYLRLSRRQTIAVQGGQTSKPQTFVHIFAKY